MPFRSPDFVRFDVIDVRMRFDSHFDSVIAFSVLAFSVASFTSVKIVQLVPIIDGWA